MPTINARVNIQNETQLGNVLRALGVLDLKSSADSSVFRLEHLVEGKTYTPGRAIQTTRKRSHRRKALASTRPNKASRRCGNQQPTGALKPREQDLRHDLYSESAEAADFMPYINTRYMRVHNKFIPISINQKDLQRRFQRSETKPGGAGVCALARTVAREERGPHTHD